MDATPQLDYSAEIPASLPGIRVSPLYRFGLALVTVAMILLPLIYIGLILAIALGVIYYAVFNFDMIFRTGTTEINTFGVRAYLVPIGVGCFVLFFMLKPFLAKVASPDEGRVLPRGVEPEVYKLVAAICSAVGAPVPKEIRVDCDSNASAGFKNGFRGMLRRDLTLTIGMPLVSGLTLRQLSGVLAHEFGHFSQNAGMRLTFIIRSINYWFARVVHERDEWDELLARWSKVKLWSWAFGLQVIAWWSRAFVWISRSILRGLMFVGHTISCFMLRQMEFDADRYGVRLAGAQTFTETAVRSHLINAATRQAYADLQGGWQERRLADNLPALIALRTSQIPESAATSVMEQIDKHKTGMFDTHPCEKDRIRSAKLENTEGLLGPEWDRPAVCIFQDFDGVGRKLTNDKYRAMLGDATAEAELVPAVALVESRAVQSQGVRQLGEYFLGAIDEDRPIYWPNLEGALRPLSDQAALDDELATVRGTMQSGAENARENFQRWSHADAIVGRALHAEGLLQAGQKLKAAEFGLEDPTIRDAIRVATEANSQKKTADIELGDFRWAAERRIEIGLSAVLREESSREKAKQFLNALAAIRSARNDLDEVRMRSAVLEVISAVVDSDKSDKKVLDSAKHVTTEVSNALDRVFEGLNETRYPFEHGQKDASLADYVFRGPVPPCLDIDGTRRIAKATIQRSSEMYLRILGQLVGAAVEGEDRLATSSSSESTG